MDCYTDPDEMLYPVPRCKGNPGCFDCPTCKGFKTKGICSHVVALNHLWRLYNVKYHLSKIPKTRRGGQRHRPPPARERLEPDADSDAGSYRSDPYEYAATDSDEEEEGEEEQEEEEEEADEEPNDEYEYDWD